MGTRFCTSYVVINTAAAIAAAVSTLKKPILYK
jgi:hypothetical protein